MQPDEQRDKRRVNYIRVREVLGMMARLYEWTTEVVRVVAIAEEEAERVIVYDWEVEGVVAVRVISTSPAATYLMPITAL